MAFIHIYKLLFIIKILMQVLLSNANQVSRKTDNAFRQSDNMNTPIQPSMIRSMYTSLKMGQSGLFLFIFTLQFKFKLKNSKHRCCAVVVLWLCCGCAVELWLPPLYTSLTIRTMDHRVFRFVTRGQCIKRKKARLF